VLAVVEHGGLVLLTLPDDDDPVHAHGAEDEAHGVDGGLVGGLLVAATDPACGGERGRLRDAHELEREVAVGTLRIRRRLVQDAVLHAAHVGLLRAFGMPRP
jgi:hypothetical protein